MKTAYKQQDLEQAELIFDQLRAQRLGEPICPSCAALVGETRRHIPGAAGAVCGDPWHHKNPPQFS